MEPPRDILAAVRAACSDQGQVKRMANKVKAQQQEMHEIQLDLKALEDKMRSARQQLATLEGEQETTVKQLQQALNRGSIQDRLGRTAAAAAKLANAPKPTAKPSVPGRQNPAGSSRDAAGSPARKNEGSTPLAGQKRSAPPAGSPDAGQSSKQQRKSG